MGASLARPIVTQEMYVRLRYLWGWSCPGLVDTLMLAASVVASLCFIDRVRAEADETKVECPTSRAGNLFQRPDTPVMSHGRW